MADHVSYFFKVLKRVCSAGKVVSELHRANSIVSR